MSLPNQKEQMSGQSTQNPLGICTWPQRQRQRHKSSRPLQAVWLQLTKYKKTHVLKSL